MGLEKSNTEGISLAFGAGRRRSEYPSRRDGVIMNQNLAVGTLVIVAERDTLRPFLSTAANRNGLTLDQLDYAGVKSVVRELSTIAGEPLYYLEDIPGTWPHGCLRATSIGHAYDHHEGTALWRAIDNELRSLEENRDIEITAARAHVIGALCEELSRLGLVKSDRSRG